MTQYIDKKAYFREIQHLVFPFIYAAFSCIL